MTALTDEEKMIMNPDELTDDQVPYALTPAAGRVLGDDGDHLVPPPPPPSPRAVPAVGPDGPVTLIFGDPDPGDWDLAAQLPGLNPPRDITDEPVPDGAGVLWPASWSPSAGGGGGTEFPPADAVARVRADITAAQHDQLAARLDRIEARLDDLDGRLAALEESCG